MLTSSIYHARPAHVPKNKLGVAKWAKPEDRVTMKNGKRVFSTAWVAPKVEVVKREGYKSLFA